MIKGHFCLIGTFWYYFDGNGYMVTGLQTDIDGDGIFIFDVNGRMFTGSTVYVNGVEYAYLAYGKYIPADISEVMDVQDGQQVDQPEVEYKEP